MLKAFLSFVALFLVAAAAHAQSAEPKPVLSPDALTPDQINIYRAVLSGFTKDAKDEDQAMNLANRTEPFTADSEEYKTCLKDVDQPKAEERPIIHRLDPAVALSAKMVLVDPGRQNETIRENDPGNLLHQAIDDHKQVSDQQLEDSVQRAVAAGLFTFSEIVFNQDHTVAAVQFSFVCGSLCGNGRTMVFKKVKGKWKRSKACSSWIS
jgi:hypothetical protein